ncbi:MAG: hypothetical protein JNJ57_12460 [Saprospiraceae bacterium]|nr:hypothetical protein [Saprospiraceae bacterium]
MGKFLPTLIRIAAVFLIFCGLQYVIIWYFLAPAGLAAGFFMYKTTDDRPMSIGLMVGSILFAIFAYSMSLIYPIGK